MSAPSPPALRPVLRVDRRRLLVGAAAGGGLLLAWSLMPRRYVSPLGPGKGEVEFGAWLRIGGDGVVTVAVPQLEMGQGVTTLIPQIVAMELGADWRQVAAQPVPVSEIWANVPLAVRWAELWMPAFAGLAGARDGWLPRLWAHRHRFTATADGMSLAAYEMPARIAAASARAMLAMAAAERWGVRWQDCAVADGFVSHGGRRMPFGALAQAAAGQTPPDPPVLRVQPPTENPAAPGGVPAFPRIDLPTKVDGSWQFAGDVRLPDMVFAAIRHAPLGEGAALAEVNVIPANGIPAYLGVVRGPDWLAAVGETWWAAERALKAIAPRFAVHRPVDTARMRAALAQGLDHGKPARVADYGDADAALAGRAGLSGEISLTRRYEVAPALHATPETASATVRITRRGWFGQRVELWLASQAPEQARVAVARALGVNLRDVVLYPMPAGGSFDARLEHAHAVEAALIAREVGRPVQLVWSRWQEHLATPPRPPVMAEMAARLDSGGGIAAWKGRLALPASAREFGARLFEGRSAAQAAARAGDHADHLALEGAVPPYAIADLAVEHVPVAIGLPTGRLRGNAHGYTAFFTESFIDELAASQSRDPLGFRMAMLGGDPRLAQCLQRVAALAGWQGAGAGGAVGAGLACHRMGGGAGGGCIAAIARATHVGGMVRVERIDAVVDIGRIVNADIARQQVEGGLLFGLGLALGSSTGHVRGLPSRARLGQLGLPLLADCPEIDVEFVASTADPCDPGELGVAVVAPAIANALAAATGQRWRSLPLTEPPL